MKNIREEAQFWAQAITFLIAWVVVLKISKTPLQINVEALTRLPEAVTLYAGLYFLFVTWLWKLPILRGWLVPLPNLTGTWKGTIQTTWQASPISRDVTLVIRQKFSSISCVLYTAESMSVSDAAVLTDNSDTGIATLSYNYQNTPKVSVRDRSVVHLGATVLRLNSSSSEWILEGEYWTNRKTTGDMRVKFVSRTLESRAPEAPASASGAST